MIWQSWYSLLLIRGLHYVVNLSVPHTTPQYRYYNTSPPMVDFGLATTPTLRYQLGSLSTWSFGHTTASFSPAQSWDFHWQTWASHVYKSWSQRRTEEDYCWYPCHWSTPPSRNLRVVSGCNLFGDEQHKWNSLVPILDTLQAVRSQHGLEGLVVMLKGTLLLRIVGATHHMLNI